MRKTLLLTIEILIIAISSVAQVNGTFTDSRDGKIYNTIKIGTQTWMAENLNFETTVGSWCYNNSNTTCKQYGRFYNWETAKNICSVGWHLPTLEEFSYLFNTTGNEEKKVYYQLISGGVSGFNALFSGGRRPNGNFDVTGYWTGFWSSSSDDDLPVYLGINSKIPTVMLGSTNKESGFSVRCIKDKSEIETSGENDSLIDQRMLIGFWGVFTSTNGSILVSNDPTSNILQFKTDWIIDLQIESIKYSRGRYTINGNQIDIKFNHISKSVTYQCHFDNDYLILQNSNEKIVLKKINE